MAVRRVLSLSPASALPSPSGPLMNCLVGEIHADFGANVVNQSDEQIRERMSELMTAAVARARSSAW